MHEPQAAISNRIATLERDLGVQLFERDLRSVSLTPAGERALSYAEAIVRLTAELKLGLLDRHTVRGRVSVGTIDSIVYAWLPAFLETVKSTYPDVNVDLTVDTSLNISRMMLNGEVDLALIAGPVLSQGYRNLDLCSYDCVWVGRAASPDPHAPDGARGSDRPSDLRFLAWVSAASKGAAHDRGGRT